VAKVDRFGRYDRVICSTGYGAITGDAVWARRAHKWSDVAGSRVIDIRWHEGNTPEQAENQYA